MPLSTGHWSILLSFRFFYRAKSRLSFVAPDLLQSIQDPTVTGFKPAVSALSDAPFLDDGRAGKTLGGCE
jgi:hypothetical protein